MATVTHPNMGKHREDFQETVEKGKDLASSLVEKGKETASTAIKSAGDVASTVGKKAQQATAAIGGGMQSLGETIEQHGPHQGLPGRVSETIADTLESTGRYLEDHNLKGIAEDVTNLIRRNPIPALLVGIGIGFLIARATRSSS